MKHPHTRNKRRKDQPCPSTVADVIDQVEHAKHRARLLMALVSLLDEFAGRDPQRKLLVGNWVPARADVVAELKGELVVEASVAKRQYIQRLGTAVPSR